MISGRMFARAGETGIDGKNRGGGRGGRGRELIVFTISRWEMVGGGRGRELIDGKTEAEVEVGEGGRGGGGRGRDRGGRGR